MNHKIIGMIPARYNSTRFPGKLLIPILNQSLLQRTYENAQLAKSLHNIYVATYDDCIEEHVKSFGGQIIRTHSNCQDGTDCVAAALQERPELMDADVIMIIQGDEPCISPECINAVAMALINDPLASMATAVIRLKTEEEALSSAVVKCVMDKHQNALYFSRQLIPSSKKQKFNPGFPYYRHIGIYAFRPAFLLEFRKLSATPLQLEEDLEQLKVLEHGYRIKVAETTTFSIGVDLPEDIQKVEQWLCKQNTFL